MPKKIFLFSLIFFLISLGIFAFSNFAVAAEASVTCTCSDCDSPPPESSVTASVAGNAVPTETDLTNACNAYCNEAAGSTCAFIINTDTIVSGADATPIVAGVCCVNGSANALATTEDLCRVSSGTWIPGVTSCAGAPTPTPTTPDSSSKKSEGIKSISLPNPLGTTDIRVIIGNIIRAFMGIIGSIALVLFMYGGFLWMAAAGDPARAKKGQQTIIAATIGLAVIFLSYTVVNFVLTSLTNIGGSASESEEETGQ